MPAKPKRPRKIQNMPKEISITTWINFLQHDIEARTSENRTNTIIAIAFASATFFLSALLISKFESLSSAIIVILGILVTDIFAMFMSMKITAKGEMHIFWKYIKNVVYLLGPSFIWILIIYIFYAPEFILIYFIFVLFGSSLLYLIVFVLRTYAQYIMTWTIKKLLIKTISEKISIKQISKWHYEISSYTFIDCAKIEAGVKVLPWESSHD